MHSRHPTVNECARDRARRGFPHTRMARRPPSNCCRSLALSEDAGSPRPRCLRVSPVRSVLIEPNPEYRLLRRHDLPTGSVGRLDPSGTRGVRPRLGATEVGKADGRRSPEPTTGVGQRSLGRLSPWLRGLPARKTRDNGSCQFQSTLANCHGRSQQMVRRAGHQPQGRV